MHRKPIRSVIRPPSRLTINPSSFFTIRQFSNLFRAISFLPSSVLNPIVSNMFPIPCNASSSTFGLRRLDSNWTVYRVFDVFRRCIYTIRLGKTESADWRKTLWERYGRTRTRINKQAGKQWPRFKRAHTTFHLLCAATIL